MLIFWERKTTIAVGISFGRRSALSGFPSDPWSLLRKVCVPIIGNLIRLFRIATARSIEGRETSDIQIARALYMSSIFPSMRNSVDILSLVCFDEKISLHAHF